MFTRTNEGLLCKGNIDDKTKQILKTFLPSSYTRTMPLNSRYRVQYIKHLDRNKYVICCRPDLLLLNLIKINCQYKRLSSCYFLRTKITKRTCTVSHSNAHRLCVQSLGDNQVIRLNALYQNSIYVMTEVSSFKDNQPNLSVCFVNFGSDPPVFCKRAKVQVHIQTSYKYLNL